MKFKDHCQMGFEMFMVLVTTLTAVAAAFIVAGFLAVGFLKLVGIWEFLLP